MAEQNINHVKYMGRMSVTYEMMTLLLNLSPELRFVNVHTEPYREVVSFIFESDQTFEFKGRGATFAVTEGQEIPCFDVSGEEIIEAMREKVRQYDIANGRLTNRELISELKEG
jgi:predicted enzyme involved in methoxymalonyl-ACP biosynthesis